MMSWHGEKYWKTFKIGFKVANLLSGVFLQTAYFKAFCFKFGHCSSDPNDQAIASTQGGHFFVD